MKDMDFEVEDKGYFTVEPIKNNRIREPYPHQKNAIKNLEIMDELPSYSTLLVLPTGAGKTFTAVYFLLKNAIAKGKKVLWIAHRQFLLEQAGESFRNYTYENLVPFVESYGVRIISGDPEYDRMNDVIPDDEVLIASKDSLGRNLKKLDKWLKDEEELYFIIDEYDIIGLSREAA